MLNNCLKPHAHMISNLSLSLTRVLHLHRQKILLLWGENDNIFNIELAMTMKEQLGEKAMLQSISKAGHLVHIERPCVYNQHLKEFLAYVNAESPKETA
jgi:pimeloyl-ACP methyl ester carboxylesterase